MNTNVYGFEPEGPRSPATAPSGIPEEGRPSALLDGVIYLDHQATTPVDPRVLSEMLPYFVDVFGNASSHQHVFGRVAAAAVDGARAAVADLVGSRPEEITFTGGATESNNLAIKGVARAARGARRGIVTTAAEHKSVLDCVARLVREDFDVVVAPVDQYGLPDLDFLADHITQQTCLVSIMAANNEVGTIAPIHDIARLTHAKGALFHCDATQLVGKGSVDMDRLGIDLLSLSAHKFYGPKGAGALIVRAGSDAVLEPILDGGGHERGLRSGTINVPGCVGLGAASRIAIDEMATDATRVNALRERFVALVTARIAGLRFNGHPSDRVPGSLSLTIPGADADDVMIAMPGVAVSSGSACTSGAPGPSHVLEAIGLSYERSLETVRVCGGRFTTETEVVVAVDRLCEAVGRVRGSVRVAADDEMESDQSVVIDGVRS